MLLCAGMAALIWGCTGHQNVSAEYPDVGNDVEIRDIRSIDEKYYTYSYRSKDAQGGDVWLSGVVAWKQGAAPKAILLVAHPTIASDKECPSRSGFGLDLLAAGGSPLLIIPDYMGFGASKERVHPYLNHDLCALHCIDALKAGYKVFKEQSGTELAPDWKLISCGFSQGGGVALAVHKWMDRHPALASEWHFAQSLCASGPYDPVATVDKYFEQNTCYPQAVLYTLNAMRDAYPKTLGKYRVEDFFSDAYNARRATVDRLMETKDADPSEAIYRAVYEGVADAPPYVRMSDLCSAAMLDPNSPLRKDFYKCLEKHNLTKGWKPRHKIRLYHSTKDDVVAYENAEHLKQAFGDMVELETGDADGHAASYAPFLSLLQEMLSRP